MKSRMAVLVVVGALGFAGLGESPAQAYKLPKMGPLAARSATLSTLRKIPNWRYRTRGYVDCSNGRVDRITWVCRVGYITGRFCRLGRSRSWYEWDAYEQTVYTSTSIRTGRPYRCEGAS